ncbi:MAG: hypothetical protein GX591_05720 [Planctomycetes bacterium]|nr:hypothetical protein [Planctomycetota bacterium]
MSSTHLSRAHEEMLIESYGRMARTLDDLPYTQEFEQLYAGFVESSRRDLSRHDLWRALTNLRKAGRLARKERGN